MGDLLRPTSMGRCRGESTKFVVLMALAVAFLLGCKRKQSWDAAPGMKTTRPLAASLEGVWVGGPWGELMVSTMGRDSLGAVAEEGVRIRGTISGPRADIIITGGGAHPSGYLYLIPSTDSLFVGLRDSSGEWSRFFTLHRMSSSPLKGRRL